MRARYYDPETGSFLSSDSYSGNLTDLLSQNRYTYAQNNPVNYIDPSGHSILGGVWNAVKSVGSFLANVGKKAWGGLKSAAGWLGGAATSAYRGFKNLFRGSSSGSSGRGGYYSGSSVGGSSGYSGGGYSGGGYSGGGSSGYSGGSHGSSGGYYSNPPRSSYERAVRSGASIFGWLHSKVKEATNIDRSWTKGLEKRLLHFCRTAKRIGKGVVEFAKNVNWKKVAIGVGVTLAITAVVVATGGSAAPVLIGAAIGGGSGALISGGQAALRGEGIARTARAASDGFMWGAINGAAGGAFGSAAVAKEGTALTKFGASVSKNPYVTRGVDIVKDTLLDTAQDYTRTGRLSLADIGKNLASNFFFGGLGGGGSGKIDDTLRLSKTVRNSAGDAVDIDRAVKNSADGYFQDRLGRWYRPDGKFASNVEVGLEPPKNKVKSSTHGNSLSDLRTNYGYALLDRDTDEILKFGESIFPSRRYSKKYLEENNAEMKILWEGSKIEVHEWQHEMNEYFKQTYGEYPPLSKGKGW